MILRDPCHCYSPAAPDVTPAAWRVNTDASALGLGRAFVASPVTTGPPPTRPVQAERKAPRCDPRQSPRAQSSSQTRPPPLTVVLFLFVTSTSAKSPCRASSSRSSENI